MARTVEEVLKESEQEFVITFEAEIVGTTSLLMNKFSELKMKGLTPEEQAEAVAHKTEDGTLYIPNDALFKTILNGARKRKYGKSNAMTFFAAGFSVVEPWVSLGTKKYDILAAPCRIPPKKGAMVMKHRPELKNWSAKFHVNIDKRVFNFIDKDRIGREIEAVIKDAGLFVGLLDNSPRLLGPHGKFVVRSFKRV